MDWLKTLPSRVWMWAASVAGGLVLLVGVYLSASGRRKGQLEIELAKRELDKANKAYDASVKQTEELHEKQKRLVADILAEQLARAELKKREGLTDEELDKRLRNRGLLRDDD